MTRSISAGVELAHVAVVAVHGVEQLGKRRAQVEAQPAAVADVEDALQFLLQRRLRSQ